MFQVFEATANAVSNSTTITFASAINSKISANDEVFGTNLTTNPTISSIASDKLSIVVSSAVTIDANTKLKFVGSVDPEDTFVVAETVSFYDEEVIQRIRKTSVMLIMAKEIDDKLNNLLDINADIKQETKLVKMPEREKNIETDYRYARENLYDLVERGQDAIDGILELSKETEHPRAYEVAGQLIKTVSETAEKLIDIQKKLKDLEKEDSSVRTQQSSLCRFNK